MSNIAWARHEHDEALDLLARMGVHSIDVAPTLLFDAPLSQLPTEAVREAFNEHRARGFSFVAMQSLLYGLPPVSLFDGVSQRKLILDHLRTVFGIANGLGIRLLVFGSPKNRFVGDFSSDVRGTARDFFRAACQLAQHQNAVLCLEANPEEYGANFITNTYEAIDLIEEIDSPPFRLNFDTSTAILNDENIEEIISRAAPYTAHVHISSPHISQILDGIDHERIASALKKAKYDGHVSLEMRQGLTDNNLKALEENVSTMLAYYS